MAEYIERKVILDELQEEMKYNSSMLTKEQNQYIRYGLRIAINDIQKLPVIDIKEARQAYWTGRLPSDDTFSEGFAPWFTEEDKKTYIEADKHTTHCSNCKSAFDDRIVSNWKYCPNCGAIMDKGSEN